ncbi:MAG TPA: hypothetical protein VK988_00635 [Acidimicrobiales bacterium]|nr:hypothetical protein [Acidimicrobiales bacterium]
MRRRMAADAVNAYAPVGGVVVDFLPGRGEVGAAARAAGRRAITLPAVSACEGRRHLAALSREEGSADLALALPSAMALATTRARPLSSLAGRVLAGQAATLLRQGGYLIVGSLGPKRSGADPITGAVAAITAQGFVYFQHVVVLLRSDRKDNQAGVADGRAVSHADLLVFERRPV